MSNTLTSWFIVRLCLSFISSCIIVWSMYFYSTKNMNCCFFIFGRARELVMTLKYYKERQGLDSLWSPLSWVTVSVCPHKLIFQMCVSACRKEKNIQSPLQQPTSNLYFLSHPPHFLSQLRELTTLLPVTAEKLQGGWLSVVFLLRSHHLHTHISRGRAMTNRGTDESRCEK